MVKALSTQIRKNLYAIFPRINENEDSFITNNYMAKYISIYDHGLEEEEYENIVIYQEDFEDNKKALDIYNKYEMILKGFYLYLYDNTVLYMHLFSKDSSTYVEFESRDEYLSYVLLSIREQSFLEIVLPEFQAIIEGRFDFTLELLVKKDYPEELDELTKIVKDHNLYILD